jgi:hypothetical protein
LRFQPLRFPHFTWIQFFCTGMVRVWYAGVVEVILQVPDRSTNVDVVVRVCMELVSYYDKFWLHGALTEAMRRV